MSDIAIKYEGEDKENRGTRRILWVMQITREIACPRCGALMP
jgi:hypothetical protein